MKGNSKFKAEKESSVSKIPAKNALSRRTPQFSKQKLNRKQRLEINPYHKSLNNHLDNVYNQTLQVTTISKVQIPMYDKMCDAINTVLNLNHSTHSKKRCLLLIIKICSLRYSFMRKFDTKIIQLLIDFIQEAPQNQCVQILNQISTLANNNQNQHSNSSTKLQDRFSLSKKKQKSVILAQKYLSKILVRQVNIAQLFKKLKYHNDNKVLWKIIDLFMSAEIMQDYLRHYDFMLRMIDYLDNNKVTVFFQREKVIDYIYTLIDIYIIIYTSQNTNKEKQQCLKRKIPLFQIALSSLLAKQNQIFQKIIDKLYVGEGNDNHHLFFLFEFLEVFSTQLHTQEDNKMKRHSYQQSCMAKKKYNMIDRFLVLIYHHKFLEKILRMLQEASVKALEQEDGLFYQDYIEPRIKNAYKLAAFLETFKIKQHMQDTIIKMNKKFELASMDQGNTSNNSIRYRVQDIQKCEYIVYQVLFQIQNVLLKSRLAYYRQVYLESPGTFESPFFKKVLNGQDLQSSANFMAQLTNKQINTVLTPYFHLRSYLQVYLFQHCLVHFKYKSQCLVKFFKQLTPDSFIKLSSDLYKDSFCGQIPQCQIPKSLYAQDMYSELSSVGMGNLYFYIDKFFQNPKQIFKWGYVLKVNKRSNQQFYLLKMYFGYLHDCFLQIPQEKNIICQILKDNLQAAIKNSDIQKSSFSLALLYLLNFKNELNTALIRFLINLFFKYRQKILAMYSLQIKIKAQTMKETRVDIEQNDTALKMLEMQKRMFNIMIKTFIKLFEIIGEQVANYIPKSVGYQDFIQQIMAISSSLTPDLCVLGTVRRLSGKSSSNIFSSLLFKSFKKKIVDIREQDLLIFRQMVYAVTYTNQVYIFQYNKLEHIKRICVTAILIIQSKCQDMCDKKFLRNKILSIEILKIIRNLTAKPTAYQDELIQFFKKQMEGKIKDSLCRIIYKHEELVTKYELQLICYLRIVTLEWIIQQISQPANLRNLRKKEFEIMNIQQFTQLLSYLVFDQNYDIRVYVISRILGKQFGYSINVPDRNQFPILIASAVRQPIQQLKKYLTVWIKKIDAQTERILFYIMSFLKFLINSTDKFGPYDQILEEGLKLLIKTKEIQIALFAFICQSEKNNKKFCKKYSQTTVSHISLYKNYKRQVLIPVQVEQGRQEQLDESQQMFKKVKWLIYQRQSSSVQQIKVSHTICIDWKLIENLKIYQPQ